jgi:anti-sigma28 factor (negative regulator of flagellin synthesis)
MKQDVLKILERIEQLRKKIENGEIKAGGADWVVRMCQAEIAQGILKTARNGLLN